MAVSILSTLDQNKTGCERFCKVMRTDGGRALFWDSEKLYALPTALHCTVKSQPVHTYVPNPQHVPLDDQIQFYNIKNEFQRGSEEG